MSKRRLLRVEIPGPAGRIDGLLHRSGRTPRFAALVSHPHPLHGGTMDNKVAYRVARALEDAGGLVLRYNFRGAGRSHGAHDEGRGEQDDLRAALRFLRQEAHDGLRVLLAGFSFGAVMSALVGLEDPAIDALLLVGAPLRLYRLEGLTGFRRPIAFVHGERDEHGPLEDLRVFVESLPAPKSLEVVGGADHFFHGRQAELAAAVKRTVEEGRLGPLLP